MYMEVINIIAHGVPLEIDDLIACFNPDEINLMTCKKPWQFPISD